MTKPTHVLTINGEEHTLTIGLAFMDALEESPKYQIGVMGINVGSALQKLLMLLSTKNGGAYRDVIKFGTMTNVKRLSDSEIEAWVTEQLNDPVKSEKMSTDFLELYKKLPGATVFLESFNKKPKPKAKKEKE